MLFLPARNTDYFSSTSEMFCNKRFFETKLNNFYFKRASYQEQCCLNW